MPSHIYMRVGDYNAAVAAGQRAIAADERDAGVHSHEGVEGTLVGHSREYLAAAAGMTGQSALALRVDNSLFPLLRFGKWDDVLAQPMPDGPMPELEWHVARVVALSARGRTGDAESERRAFDAAVARLPPDATWWADPAARFVTLANAEMDARMAWVRGDRMRAIAAWRAAVQAQDVMTHTEALLPWFHPVRESLGAALYLTRNFKEAEAVFREDLARTPNNPRSLYGLWRTLDAQGRTNDLAPVREAFTTAWRNADAPLRMEDLQ
jgi:tetratricopeptide (TPR) repeat protein